MSRDHIIIKGAKEHNLKEIDARIPRNRLTVVTGLSGSGKSSLAFDTLYAEGQRRYVESLSSYARQFLEQLQKPSVEYIEGLSPAISIEQRSQASNPRSTVGTVTEIYDYLRLLFARIGTPHCYKCGREISKQSSQEIVQRLVTSFEGSTMRILSPLVTGKKGEHKNVFDAIQKEGFVRARVDGRVVAIEEVAGLDKKRRHSIEALVDSLKINTRNKKRLTDSVEIALGMSGGTVIASEADANRDYIYSELYACTECGISYDELTPRIFSFNSPYGACPDCGGLGNRRNIDPELVIPDKSRPLIQAIAPWRRGGKGIVLYYRRLLRQFARDYGFDVWMPYKALPKGIKKILLWGDIEKGGFFEGIIENLERRFRHTKSEFVKSEINKFMSDQPCPSCGGARLRKESLAVTVGGKNINGITAMSVSAAGDFFSKLKLRGEKKVISKEILKEISARLGFMNSVGLDYLTLDRVSFTLSGGESQRIRLATQIGAGLVGVLYILDEPSIGLHQRDNKRLLDTLAALRDLGNTLVVVEHDEATIRKADHIIDLGPGAGEHGGRVIAAGPLESLLKNKESLTAKYLNRSLSIPVPGKRKVVNEKRILEIIGASEHNLKNINVKIPLGLFVCVTGVSGSGKSTLVEEILFRQLSKKLYRSKVKPGKHKGMTGAEMVDKVIVIDQSPIGRTPRSNPATYTGAFGPIRNLFSRLPESRMRGYKPGRFSFNIKGGRCEACKGDGIKKIEMHFLPDVYVKCEVCGGRRFNDQTLEIKYKGYSISDVLDMSVEEAHGIFKNIPSINCKLETLSKVGLDYIRLGQPSTTLSGGEAQRIKLATELSRRSTGKTLYILDEPTTGLHFADIDRLLEVLHVLVEGGNTVVVIEHNLEVIKNADYIIDLGPEGGDNGGRLVASGTPEDISRCEYSYTGLELRHYLC